VLETLSNNCRKIIGVSQRPREFRPSAAPYFNNAS